MGENAENLSGGQLLRTRNPRRCCGCEKMQFPLGPRYVHQERLKRRFGLLLCAKSVALDQGFDGAGRILVKTIRFESA